MLSSINQQNGLSGLFSPLVRSVIYPSHEKLLSRPTFGYLRELEDSQWWDRQRIEQLQYQKLKNLLIGAKQGSLWYRQAIEAAGLDLAGDSSLTLEALRKLPTTCKADMQAHGDDMVCRQVPGGLYPYNTGGSSGSPLTFYFSRLRQASDAAGRIRARRWWGVDVGDPEVYLWGAPVELSKTDKVKKVRDRLFNQLVLNAFNMSPASMDHYIDAITAFKPKCIYGYASSIALLAAHAQAANRSLRLPSLRVVCTTGEPVYPHQRQLIETVFGVPVANEFGSRDIGFTAHETPEGQMLLMSESHILEVLDGAGNPVAEGETGEAVVTGLCSDAQPFIRYRTGDMVKISNTACKAGRGLHVIDSVQGRTTDFVVRSDGTILHALAVIYVLRAVAGIAEFKFIQHALDRVEILVVTNPDWAESDRQRIVQGVQDRLGTGVQVEIITVDAIECEQSGKYRYVVSHVPLPAELSIADAGSN